ncbi:MAG: Dabb family protein [Clostridiales bacterium]|jgi:hypothetical protein|nr:Dabb family protein [Clostridiales bacterium]NLZ90560.1 Dabb family protein [Clostridiales bacterium]HOC09597.1 Dabb family protein [Bacillota bacterium]HQA48344.1 Dabb family protein [Bacillota bacterium]HQD42096.1 Dabb family protein [Bacillota bacterium]
MVKHIVAWKLKSSAGGRDRQENASIMKERVEGLKDKIKEILQIEVGINVNTSSAAYDVVLYSEFKDMESLDVYQNHPEHLEVKAFVEEVTQDRIVVDYLV